MAINKNQFIEELLIPAWRCLDDKFCSEDAIILGCRTCAVESDFCTNWVQLENGIAKNPFGIEPGTFEWLWNTYLPKRQPEVQLHIMSSSNLGHKPIFGDLTFNVRLALQIMRVNYWRIPEAIPDASDIEAQAEYWKTYYNTRDGKGTVNKFIEKSKKYGL